MSHCNFSYQHYREILDLAKEEYEFTSFFQRPDNKVKKLYLRHDIDIALDKAPPLAEIEHQKGVTATYFLQINSPFYSLLDEKSLKIIKKISSLGHHLGLHLDERLCSFSKNTVIKEVEFQLSFLRRFFPIKKIVSFHRPSRKILNRTLNPGKIVSTYEPDFFTRSKYLSDSTGNWREICPCKILKQGKYFNLQILTHPILWGETSKSASDALQEYLKQKIKALDHYLVKHEPNYHSISQKI